MQSRPSDLIFPKAAAARREGICPFCHQLVDTNSFRDELSRKEFGISGLCQKCQDETFKDPDEEKDMDIPENHNYYIDDTCDSCGEFKRVLMMHAKGATGRICPVLALCDKCRKGGE